MLRRKPEALARTVVALIGTLTVLTVFLTDLLLSRRAATSGGAGERRAL
ncbi:MAG: hypothetical protein MZW92_00570 [Comamonadaceae bacterium]|nr:hypothetical protein [Comamonadaceae bacterium]